MNPFFLDAYDRRALTLMLLAVFFAVNFGWRTVRQLKTTGSSGFRGMSGSIGSVEWLGGVLFVIALLLGFAAPIGAYLGIPAIASSTRWFGVLATLIVVIGITGTTLAQLDMGKSWRIGVNKTERTDLILTGLFSVVRNSIFSFMILTSMGLTWLLPNWPSIAATVLLIVAIQFQVRFVEEPSLARVHGLRYEQYGRNVGRFIPNVGRA